MIDAVGHRRVTVAGLIVLLLASLLGLNATSVAMLVAARIGSGIAVALITTVALSGLGTIATNANRGKVMSLFHVANNTGIAFYPLVGGVIGAGFGWRATFVVTIALAVVAGAILLPVLFKIHPRGRAAARTAKAEPRVLHGRQRTIALAAINYGVVANMINRHGFRNTVLPLYAAAALGLGGVSIATAIALTAGLAALAGGDLVFMLTHDLVTFLATAALIGFGDFFSSSQTALLSEVVPSEQRTKVLAGYRFSADLGAFIGPVMLAAVMDFTNAQTAIALAAAILVSASAASRFGVPARVDDRPARRSVPTPVLKGAVDDPR